MTERKKLSVYVITYNEEKKIRDCLESVNWADEIVIVDSYSSDKTLDICKEYTEKIFQKRFDGFGKLRNYALEHVKYDWVLSVDADERVTEELKEEILQKLTEEPTEEAYFIPRKSHFLNYWVRHCGWYPDYRQPQFFNKTKMKYVETDLVHEGFVMKSNSKVSYLKNHIIQYPFLSLKEFLTKMDRYSTLKAQQMFNESKSFKFHQIIFHPLSCFLRMFIFKLGFLDGKIGFILSILYSYYTFIKYIKLWELQLNYGR